MNTEYLLWFALLVAVTGSVLVWLAIGDLPEIPADPGAVRLPGAEEILARGPAPEPTRPHVSRSSAVDSETAGEDGVAGNV